MDKNLIFTNKEIKFLQELVKNKVNFMIVGLSAAALQGSPVVTQDIDLWFENLSDQGLKKALKKVGGFYIPSIQLNPPLFGGDAVQLFDIVLNMSGLGSFSCELKNTKEIVLGKTKVKVLSLERILKSKKAANRKKDQLVIPVLEDVLKVLKAKEKK